MVVDSSEIQARIEAAIAAAQKQKGESDPGQKALEAFRSHQPALASLDRLRQPLVILPSKKTQTSQ